MAIQTYDDVVAALGNWLDRNDLTDRAPEFIALLEAQVNRKLRVREMETRAVSSVGTADEFVDIPPDFLQIKSLTLSDGVNSWPLNPEPLEVLEQAPPMTGCPVTFAILGDSIHLYPKPDKTYTATLVYYARIPALTSDNQTNWLLTKAPDVYLYGALTQAAPFLEDDSGTGNTFTQLYVGALKNLQAEQKTLVGKLRTNVPRRLDQYTYNIYRGTY